MDFDGFDWDDGNEAKCSKHGVSRIEIEASFRGEPRIGPDVTHSSDEQRFRAVGLSIEGRYIFTVFTWRRKGNARVIRPISARYMHRKEIDAFEETIS